MRGPIKKLPVDTVQYEIKMLRYCCEKVKELRIQRSDDERYEYNLAIESFLLHYRNLIEFSAAERFPWIPTLKKLRQKSLMICP